MDQILESRSESTQSAPEPPHLLAPSAPLLPPKIADEVQVKTQISAPSYLFSLRENDAPPFKIPGKKAKPRLMIGTILNETEVIEMIAAGETDVDGVQKFIGRFLVEKKIIDNFSLSEKKFLISLLTEAIDYAAQREFTAFKLAVFFTIYIDTHLFFKWYYWLPPMSVWQYFKENMIRHTIEDSPDGQEVFDPEECFDIVTHFHTVYMSNLPLIHIVCFGAYRLRFVWPFKPKWAYPN